MPCFAPVSMKLRTALELPSYDFKLGHSAGVITLGSCFSEVIGRFLEERKFTVMSNPFGTIYNLESVYEVVSHALDDRLPDEARMVSRDGLFFHLDYHSEFYSDSPAALLERIRAAGREFREFLAGAGLLIITPGTSRVYTWKEKGVSNCHKLPASRFGKRLLGLEEQRELLNGLITRLRSVNPALKVMLTVSPVRHTKDGLPENSVSKALLRVLCDEAVNRWPGVYYFPSFEVMMDDLRDYRFYKPDLIHPDEVAEGYIAELFMKSVMTEEACRRSEEWSRVRTALAHRPLNPGTEAHRVFLVNLLDKIGAFRPFFDVSEEYEAVHRRLLDYS